MICQFSRYRSWRSGVRSSVSICLWVCWGHWVAFDWDANTRIHCVVEIVLTSKSTHPTENKNLKQFLSDSWIKQGQWWWITRIFWLCCITFSVVISNMEHYPMCITRPNNTAMSSHLISLLTWSTYRNIFLYFVCPLQFSLYTWIVLSLTCFG